MHFNEDSMGFQSHPAMEERINGSKLVAMALDLLTLGVSKSSFEASATPEI